NRSHNGGSVREGRYRGATGGEVEHRGSLLPRGCQHDHRATEHDCPGGPRRLVCTAIWPARAGGGVETFRSIAVPNCPRLSHCSRGGARMELTGRDIICLSNHYWDERWFRKQEFMSRFAQANRILYVEPSFSMARPSEVHLR